MYFLKTRRLFCLLRLWEFFRASSFMVILLVIGRETLLLLNHYKIIIRARRRRFSNLCNFIRAENLKQPVHQIESFG